MKTSTPSSLLLLAALCLLQLPSTVQATGAFFGRQAPDHPVAASHDSIVYGLGPNNMVTMQIQLDYKKSTELQAEDPFAWILPLPVAPTKVTTGSSLLFDALFEATRPTFDFTVQADVSMETAVNRAEDQAVAQDRSEHFTTRRADAPFNNLRQSGGNSGGQAASEANTCSADALNMTNLGCPSNDGPTRGDNNNNFGFTALEPPSQVIVERGIAGIFNYTVLSSGTGDSEPVLTWLTDHGYTFDADNTNLQTALDNYVQRGFVFLAVQLNPDEDVYQQIGRFAQPLHVQYQLPETSRDNAQGLISVPLHLGLAQNLTLQLYFLSQEQNSRAIPVNYLDATLDDAYVDWIGCLDENALAGSEACYQADYEKRFQAVVQQVQAANSSIHVVTTEFSGPSLPLLQNQIHIDTTVLEGLYTAADWLEFMTEMEAAGISGQNRQLQDIILQFVPITFLFEVPFQCAQWKQIYHPGGSNEGPTMEDCFDIFDPPADWKWEPARLANTLMEEVFYPANKAQEWLDSFQHLTRFLGYVPLSDAAAATLIKEPYFTVTTGKPLVSRHHRATAVPICPDGDGQNPTSLEITVLPASGSDDSDNEAKTFWQAAILRCPTWQKTAPHITWSPDQASSRPYSYAQHFMAHGIANAAGVMVGKNEEAAGADGDQEEFFDPDALQEASDYGDDLLRNLTLPTAASDDGEEQDATIASASAPASETPVPHDNHNLNMDAADAFEEDIEAIMSSTSRSSRNGVMIAVVAAVGSWMLSA